MQEIVKTCLFPNNLAVTCLDDYLKALSDVAGYAFMDAIYVLAEAARLQAEAPEGVQILVDAEMNEDGETLGFPLFITGGSSGKYWSHKFNYDCVGDDNNWGCRDAWFIPGDDTPFTMAEAVAYSANWRFIADGD